MEPRRKKMAETELIVGPGKREVTIRRTFDAPRDLVWQACTDPELIPRWWGPEDLTTTVDEMDVRSGGSWRIVQRDAGGNEYVFFGAYREIAPPKRIAETFEFESMPGHGLLETDTFEDLGGRTMLTTHLVFRNAEDRERMLQAGMKEEMAGTMDRLAALLANLIVRRRPIPVR
ncbi:putative glutathione s-transferase-related transmembrane [hydrocarbon metagenome]|uniref:Putative glutathione s-transferase-related transmembrane n=1 Tax=hydrocarbon metagenome TaxID=938273 RepID=A0A0W8FDL8_9ZZZZ|nr:SRPBCC family protein [Methanomicrobiaceae archaeon]